MHFGFSEDQRLFQSSLAELLANECTHEAVAGAWKTEDGYIPGLWARLAELGILAVPVPEKWGGLGLSDIDLVLLLEEVGRFACPEPVADVVGIAAPLLAEIGGPVAEDWLPRIVSGAAKIAVGVEDGGCVAGAAAADLLLLRHGDELHAVLPNETSLHVEPSVDGARRRYRVEWAPAPRTRLTGGEEGWAILARAFDRGAVAAAAQLLGLGRQLLDLTVAYAKERVQFGQPIGTFQAVKHHLANAHTAIEMARPPVYFASYSVAKDVATRTLDVSTAKALASDAAYLCSRTALQCHGAIAYTYEYHAHMWMKRTLVLRESYGSAAWHRKRAAGILLDGDVG